MLIVEDDERIRDILYDLFADWQVCHVASTAEQALAYLADETYDVVLSDISMPGLSGLELLGHIRQRYPEIVVIIVSGIDDQEHAQGLLKMGAYEYIVKPFRLEDVEASVGRALEYRRRWSPERRGKDSDQTED